MGAEGVSAGGARRRRELEAAGHVPRSACGPTGCLVRDQRSDSASASGAPGRRAGSGARRTERRVGQASGDVRRKGEVVATSAGSGAPTRDAARPALRGQSGRAGPEVSHPGTAVGAGRTHPAGRLRSLNRPRPIKVEAGEDVQPLAVHISGRPIAIESVVETWRIDDEWWREKAVSRQYWRVVLEDGRGVDVYRGLVTGRWWRQAY